jgi:hypothetical protein
MRARDVAGSLALVLASGGAGCLSTSAFECETADDCRDAGVDGRCEPTGFCSFPDDGCPSDHRYGDHAGDGLGGMCVPEGDDTIGTSTFDPTTSASDSDTALTDAATTNADETPLTDGPDASSAVSLEGESSASTSTTAETTGTPDESSSTGAEACPSFADDFEDGDIDPAWTTMSGEFVTEANGELTFALSPELDQVYPGAIQYGFDFASGWLRMRVGLPPGSDAERMYLALSVDPEFTEVVYIMIEGSIVYARYELTGEFVDLGALEFSPEEHAWLQIRGDGDDVVFEASADASTFVEVATVPAPFPLLDTTIVVAATNFAVLPMTTYVSVTDVELCEGA